MSLILRWISYSLGVIAVAYVVPGFNVSGFYAALVTIIILGLVNVLIRPIIIILTLPINILSLGLFTLIINSLMLWFVSTIVEGFTIENFGAALWGALILWLIGWAVNAFLD